MRNAVHIENLSVCYGKTVALKDINLDVQEGELLGIIGPNGGGKSTLLKTILKLIKPSSGKVELYGGGPKQPIGYVPQFADIGKQFPISVEEAVLAGRLKGNLMPFFRYNKADRLTAIELLDKVGLKELKDRHIAELSGGEFQKMLIARALTVNPGLLLLDEPTANVDTSSAKQIFELLDELSGNMTIILVTHDLSAVSSHVGRLACLNQSLVYHGEPELNEHIVENLYGCPVDIIAHGIPHRVLKEH